MAESYFEDAEAFCKKAGVILDDRENNDLNGSSDLNCIICDQDYSPSEFVLLDCGNIICKNCLTEFIKCTLESSEPPIKCPFDNCSHFLGSSIIRNYSSPELYDKFIKLLSIKHVKASKDYRICSKCGSLVKLRYGESPEAIQCTCGNFFCWNCGGPDHRPLTCIQITKWNEIFI